MLNARSFSCSFEFWVRGTFYQAWSYWYFFLQIPDLEGNLRKIFNFFRLRDPKITSSKISCFFKIDDGSFVFSNCTILLKRPERAVCYDARDEAWEEEQLEGSDIHLVSAHPIERKKNHSCWQVWFSQRKKSAWGEKLDIFVGSCYHWEEPQKEHWGFFPKGTWTISLGHIEE